MRFIIGLVLGVLLGMWLQTHNYVLRLPFAPAADRDVEAQPVAPLPRRRATAGGWM